MDHLADGLCLQLMNCPLDLFVEHMIYTTYKDMRPIQLLSLFHQEMNNYRGIEKGKRGRLLSERDSQSQQSDEHRHFHASKKYVWN